MAQIISSSAKPDRVNLSDLSLIGIPALGTYILVSSDNSMTSDGKANFDYYIVGDGSTAATSLELNPIVGTDFVPTSGSKEPVASGGLYEQMYSDKIEYISTTSIAELAVGSSTIGSNSAASVAYFFTQKGKTYNIVVSATNNIRFGFTKVVPAEGVAVSDYATLTTQVDKIYTASSDGYICISYATEELNSIDIQRTTSYGIGVELSNLRDSIYTHTQQSITSGRYNTYYPGLYYQSTSGKYCSVFSVSEGQRVIIYGEGNSDNTERLWALYNSNDRRVRRFTSSGNFRTTPEVVVIPSGVAKMVVNLYNYDSTTDKVLVVGDTSSFAQMESDIEEIQETLGEYESFTELNGIVYSSGSTFGLNTNNDTRARTNKYISAPFKVTTNTGFLIQNIFQYSLDAVYETTTASSYTSVNDTTATITDENYLYRISFTKTDNTETITSEEAANVAEFSFGMAFYMEYFNDKITEFGNTFASMSSFGKSYACQVPDTFITSYSTLIAGYDAIVAEFPTLVTKNTLGQNSLGTDIYEYVISGGNYNTTGVWGTLDTQIAKPIFSIWAGTHGYERSAINSLYLIFKDLLGGNGALSPLLIEAEIHLIPCLNPWGFDNDKRYNPNSVDINRNFEEGWTSGSDHGDSAASEAETQIAQAWITSMAEAGTKFIIDWHNSLYVDEINCVSTGSGSISGTDTFKTAFLRGTSNVASVLINKYGVPEDAIFSYTSVDTAGGKSGRYMAAKSVIGGYAETSWNPDGLGVNTVSAAAIGATSMGNALIELLNDYGI